MPTHTGINRGPMLDQLKRLDPQGITESFEEAVKKLACHAVVKTADTRVSMMQQHQVHVDQVFDTSKELWQSLAQAASHKRSPSYTKPPDSASDKCSSKGVGSNAETVTVPVTNDGSESGDCSCNSSAKLVATATKQVKSVMERTAETGAGDAKSVESEESLTPSRGWAGWQTVNQDGAVKADDESIDSQLGDSQLDTSEVIEGEESFYSVTSGDLVPQSDAAAAEPATDDDDDDDRLDVSDDAADVNETQTEGGTHVSCVKLR